MISKDKISDSSELKLKRKTPYNKNKNHLLKKCNRSLPLTALATCADCSIAAHQIKHF